MGGVAALGAYYARLRADAAGCPVFLVSAGDVMQGTLSSNLSGGESMIAALNLLGYDAAAIGNHEFDWGIETLRRRMEEASFPFLSANIYVAGTDRHPSWARPYAILERGGVRIGVVGATTRQTPVATHPANVAGLEFRSIAEALDRYIPRARAEGVDFVIVLLHAGGFCDDAGQCEGEALRALARGSEPYDYAVTGHTHSRIETRVRGAPVVQSFSNTTAFSLGRLERRAGGEVDGRLLEVRTAWADEVEPDPALEELAARAEAAVREKAREPVATLAEPLPKSGPEYGLGRLIADAQREATGAQVAIMNNGGIRTGLPAGVVTFGDLFKLQPFQNALLDLRLRGSVLLSALDHAAGEESPGAHLSGVRVVYDPAAPAGSRVLSATLTSGERVVEDGVYTVTVNDFMAAGGSGFSMLREAETAEPTGIVDLDALVDHLRALPQPVHAPPDARWIQTKG